jgi:hypothetical protein
VVEVHSRGAFWGTIPDPPAGVSVGVRLDSVVASSASGSARVLGVDPLRIQLDIAASGSGRQLPINGMLVLAHESWTQSCFE